VVKRAKEKAAISWIVVHFIVAFVIVGLRGKSRIKMSIVLVVYIEKMHFDFANPLLEGCPPHGPKG
jgi:hypothetical protein